MSDMERDADRIGRQIWPVPGAVLERLGRHSGPGRGSRRGILVGVATAAALAAVLVLTVALRGGGGSASGGLAAAVPASRAPSPPPATATLPPAASPEATTAAAGTATVSTATAGTATLVPPRTAAATATPTAPTSTTVTLTERDSGRTVTVHAGTTVVVQLAPQAAYSWTEPDSSNAAAVSRVSGAVNPDGSAGATFHAVAPGSSDLTATENPNCLPQGCRPPSRLWSVTVIVVA